MAVLALTVLGAAVPAGAAGAAIPGPGQLQVQVTSPAAGADVTGNVPVTVHISGDGTATPTQVRVTIASTTVAAQTRSGTLTGLDPACATACDVVVTVDTMSWKDPGDDPQAVPTMLDNGPATVGAQVLADSAAGQLTADAAAVSVNVTGRNTLSNNSPRIQVYRGSGSDLLRVNPPGSQQLPTQDHLVVTIFGNGYHRDLSVTPDPRTTSYWQAVYNVQFDGTGMPDGMYWERAVSIGADGNASTVVLAQMSVYAGPVIHGASLTAVDPATNSWHDARLTVAASTGPGGAPYAPKSFLVSIDGQGAQAPQFTYDHATGTASMLLDVVGGQPVTSGPHTVTITYTETVGTDWWLPPSALTATTTWTGQVTASGIALTPTVHGPVAEGVSGTLQLGMTSVPDSTGFSPKVASWRVEDINGYVVTTLGSGTCLASCADMSVTVPLSGLTGGYPGNTPIGEHYLHVTVTDDVGVPHQYTVRVHVDANPRPNMAIPKSAPYGSTVRVSATVGMSDSEPLPGVPMVFQARTAGTDAWHTVASVVSGADGSAAAFVKVGFNTQWRTVVDGRPGWNGPAISPTYTTNVPANLRLSVPATARANRPFLMATTVTPQSAGRLVYVVALRSGSRTWVVLSKPRTDWRGIAWNTLTLPRGTWYVRTVASGTIASATGYSTTATTVIR